MTQGRTGKVGLRDFDQGLVTTLGGVLTDVVLDGEVTQAYALVIDGLEGPVEFQGRIPIIVGDPEDVFYGDLLPSVVVRLANMPTDMGRWMPYGEQYKVPATGSNPVTITKPDGTVLHGADAYEIMEYAYPFDFMYDVQTRGRRKYDALRIETELMKVLRPNFPVFVTDSVGDDRGYDAFYESVNETNDVTTVGERAVGKTFSVKIQGELDLREPIVSNVLTSNVRTGIHKK